MPLFRDVFAVEILQWGIPEKRLRITMGSIYLFGLWGLCIYLDDVVE
jgi:hypothetical protein